MTEHDYLEPLTDILRARRSFGHRQHLELAWTYLARGPVDSARRHMAAAIRHVAQLHGAPDRYHETVTQAWVLVVAAHHRRSAATTFDEFLAEFPALLDRHLLDRHYSAELLASAGARAHWTMPDLRPFPPVA